ncbi:MAG TPA: ATP-binding cassette domain-containing protein [Patescibacteria group bacterium]|nr:ATP-binding cassette domain-containing protein [Patescibacteria group bacterium]
MVEFVNVSKNFGRISALNDVSFKIEKGEFVFIIGPSGSGKTTVLRLLLREFPATSGKIMFDGIDITKLSKSKIPVLRQSIGVVFQDFKLLKEKTVGENIEMALAIKGVPKSEWETRKKEVLKLVGLANRSELFPAQLSGGELQRVAIARAMSTDPKIIFADEPTGNLDWETSEVIMELLDKINKAGKTIIVTSHNLTIIKKMKKRTIKLVDGKVESK